MSAPTIIPTTSVLDYSQWQFWSFAPNATGLDMSTPVSVQTAANFARQLPDATVATTAALPANTYSNGTAGVGATLTATGNGALTIDGYAVATGDRVLVKNEVAAVANGLYVVTNPGASGAAYELTRDTAMDVTAHFVGFIQVDLGTANSQTLWLCPVNAITVGTTAVTFYQWKNRWQWFNLPPGMVYNPCTGVVSGAASAGGVFNASVQVSNTAGPSQTWSAAIYPCIGLALSAFSAESGVDLDVDTETGAVSISGGGSNAPAANGDPQPLISAKEGNQILLYIHFKRRATDINLGTLTSLKIGIKEFEPDPVVVPIGGGDTVDTDFKILTTTPQIYLMVAEFTGATLAAELSNYEADKGTFFNGLAEIEWQEPNATGIGPNPLQRSSATFPVRIERNLVA